MLIHYKLHAGNSNTVADLFPYLPDDVSYDELYALDENTKKLKRAFASLVFNLQMKFEKTNEVGHLANILRLYDTQFSNLINCSTVQEVFNVIYPHISFFDTGIIQLLIKGLGSDSEKQEMEEYQGRFKEFSKRHLQECPSDAFGDVPESERPLFIMKLDLELQKLTINDLQKLKATLCDVMNLKSRLLCVKRGCTGMILRTLPFSTITLTVQQQQILKEHHVLNIQYADDFLDLSISPIIEKTFQGVGKVDY